MKYRFQLLALVALLLSFGIPLILGGTAVWPALAGFPGWLLLVMLLMIFLGWNLNAGRLRLLAGGTGVRLGHRDAVSVVMATEFAYSATPGGSGGPATYAWLLRNRSIPAPRALAMYVTDQLMDMVFFVTAMLLLIFYWTVAPTAANPGWQLLSMGAMLAGGLLTVLMALRHYRRVLIFLGRILRRFNVKQRTRIRLARWAIDFRHSLGLIQSFSRWRLGGVFCLCSLHWLLRYSILYLAIHGLGASISWSYTFIVQMLSLTAGHATLLPGGSGGAEASSSLLLAPYLDPTTAAAAILIWRFVTFYWYLIAGAPVFAVQAGQPLWRHLTQSKGINPATK